MCMRCVCACMHSYSSHNTSIRFTPKSFASSSPNGAHGTLKRNARSGSLSHAVGAAVVYPAFSNVRPH